MKFWKLTMFLLVAALMMAGCEEDTIFDPIPAAPQNIQSITADDEVYVYFNGLYETDIDEYWIYRSLEEYDGYTHVGTVQAEYNPLGDTLFYYEWIDTDVVNGVTYFYAIAAVDFAGHVSELSAETIWDTPRPEGYVSVYFWNNKPDSAGFDFSTHSVVSDGSEVADIWFDYEGSINFINVGRAGTDYQDMGFTEDFDEISMSPDSGWATTSYTEMIEGHTYVIWTHDNHFAKVRIEKIYETYVRLRWGYQIDPGNIQFAPRPPHDEEFLRDKREMSLLR